MSALIHPLRCPVCPSASAGIESVVRRYREATGEVVPLCPTHGWLRHPHSDGWLAPANCPGCGRGLIRFATVKSECCSERCSNRVRCRRKRSMRKRPQEPEICGCGDLYTPIRVTQLGCGKARCRKRLQRAALKAREAREAEARQALEAAAQVACKCGGRLVVDGLCSDCGHWSLQYLQEGGLDALAA